MKRLLLFCCVIWSIGPAAQANTLPDTWDLVRAYNASTYVFYGEIVKTLPERDFKTGVKGVHPDEIDGSELPLEEIVWPKAKELSFAVSDALKDGMPTQFVAYLADPSMGLWTHLVNETGDVFLAKPQAPDVLLLKLRAGDKGLFFIRHYLGSTIPVVYQVRYGQLAQDDLKLLQAYRAASNQSLESIVKEALAREEAAARQDAAEFKVFEDEYYKILRFQDLEIRRSMLNDLIERMGFTGLWDYFEYKQRYLQQFGAHVQANDIPRGPTEGKKKLWHDISGELKKIEVMLKARAR
jgi:hypothetical protein